MKTTVMKLLPSVWLVTLLFHSCQGKTKQSFTTLAPEKRTTAKIEYTEMTTESTQDEIDDLQTQIDILTAQVANLTAVVEAYQQNTQIAMDTMETDIDTLQQDVDQVEEDLESFEETINYNNAKPLCEDYSDDGFTKSGYYMIDPDHEEGEMEPFQVYCDFDTDPDYAITMVEHDSENRTLVDGCEDPGCYSRNVTYTADLGQITALLAKSRTCQQYIKYECLDSMLFHYDREAWWKSRNGSNQYYWGGATPGSEMCKCGVEGNCDLDSTTCNCDLNDPVWREDDGYFTNMDLLPVTQLNFGDTEALDEIGYHTLGKLECRGRAIDRTCRTLKLAGNPSGYYTINPSPLTMEDLDVYCDMETYPGTGITVIEHDTNTTTHLVSSTYYSTGYHKNVSYGISMEKLEYLINISSHCTQFISWRCYKTGLLYGGYSWWVSRNGEKMTYWGGAEPSHDKYCACGEKGTCAGGTNYNFKCNCDEYATNYWRWDAGELVDKNKLPVTELRFGFIYSNANYGGYYDLGPLRCF